MDSGIKWIIGASLALLALIGGAAVAGQSLESDAAEPRLAAENVLDFDPAPRPAARLMAPPAAPASAMVVTPSLAADEPFVIKKILPISGAIKYGEWHWDDEGVAPGPLVVTVDLEARVISVFRGGYEIGAAAVLLGTQDHPTPLGRFPILQKKKDNVSSIYDAPMPYTMRLTWDGISIHGSSVENGYASHGCVGTPEAFAAKLFAVASKGDVVIITRGVQTGVGKSLMGG